MQAPPFGPTLNGVRQYAKPRACRIERAERFSIEFKDLDLVFTFDSRANKLSDEPLTLGDAKRLLESMPIVHRPWITGTPSLPDDARNTTTDALDGGE